MYETVFFGIFQQITVFNLSTQTVLNIGKSHRANIISYRRALVQYKFISA